MEPFCIPWSCVDLSRKQSVPDKSNPKTQKSFAQAASNVCEIPLSQLPQPCVKGDEIAIPIPEEEYSACVMLVNIIYTVESFGPKEQLR
jgi:hypothetical protein